MKVAIAGASGLIGTALTKVLAERGDEVVRLPRFGTAPWSIAGAGAVVNLAGAIVACIDTDLAGPVNLVAPGIVTMAEFAKALGRALHRPSAFHVPAAALRLLLGEVAEVLLEGQRAVPRKLFDAGFRFRFTDV